MIVLYKISGDLISGASLSTFPTKTRECESSLQRPKNEDRKILVTNISRRVTANQLKSFFSKFGPVSSFIMYLF